ncbi:hypothetical protein CBB2_1124 [Clostridium botulinum]|nr:hypothetical protein CBB2_1124 [Clostridium botulinum]
MDMYHYWDSDNCKSWDTIIICNFLGGKIMIEKINANCKKLNDLFGVNIKLPNPSKHTLRASVVVNCTMGVGLILFGALSSQKWTAALGGLSIVGSVISSEEAKKK